MSEKNMMASTHRKLPFCECIGDACNQQTGGNSSLQDVMCRQSMKIPTLEVRAEDTLATRPDTSDFRPASKPLAINDLPNINRFIGRA